MAAPERHGYYDELDFNSPMTDSTATELVDLIRRSTPSRVVDVGCGWAELLLRVLDACSDATGLGIDRDQVLLDRARSGARQRGLEERLAFVESYAPDALSEADTVLCIGSEHVIGSLDDALRAFAEAAPQARVLMGTAFWQQTPPASLLEQFGELPTLERLLDQVAALGWRTGAMVVADDRDWDRFEFGFMADMVDAEGYRRAYLERRGVLGFAYLLLERA